MQDKSQMVMEIVRFGAVRGVGPAELGAAAQEGREWLARQPGFITRALCQEGDSYVDLVTWADLASAQTAAAQVMSEPAFARFMGMIDATSVRLDHLPLLVSMP